jgi:hypothetical protein
MCSRHGINGPFRACFLPMLCALAVLLFDQQAHAQCSARDVIRRHPSFIEQSSSSTVQKLTEPAAATKVWKSVQVGTFASKRALYQALDDADCAIGDTAVQILVAPEFRLGREAMKLDLVAISVSALGFARDKAALKNVYARAQSLGFALAPPEVGPQLRLQYSEQPMGESLKIAMAPLRTRAGPSSIFTVVNGGAGLLLLAENVASETELDPSSRFVFVRPMDVAEHQ